MSLSSGFSKLSVLDPLSSPKPMSLHNFSHVVTRNSKRVALRCLALRTTKKPLRLVSHHTPTHCHVFREALQQILCQFTGTHSQHVVLMHTNADVQFRVRNQTRIALILNETVSFQLARQVPASVSEMFADPAWPLHTFHTTRLPSIRIFGFQPSGDCACSCSPSRTLALRKACVQSSTKASCP